MQKIIEVKNLSKIYKLGFRTNKIKALNNLSFNLEEGKILGVIGPNGSGKTTLFKCILGFISEYNGDITLFNGNYNNFEKKSRIGFLPEKFNFYSELTPCEALFFYGKLFKVKKQHILERIDNVLNIVSLNEFKNVRMNSFSKGMLQRLGIAMSLIHDAKLLIFDEPSSGLDPIGSYMISEILLKLAKNGKTVIVSSHVLSHIQDTCDELIILYKGNLIKSGSMKDIIENKSSIKIEVKINCDNDKNKIVSILESNGFKINDANYTNQDLENIFVALMKEE